MLAPTKGLALAFMLKVTPWTHDTDPKMVIG